MILSDYLRIPLRNVIRGRTRTFLSASAMAVGIACVVILGVIGITGKTAVNDQLERIGINGIMVFAGENGGLSMSDAKRVIDNIAEVSVAMPFDVNIANYSFRNGVQRKATVMYVAENIDLFMGFDLLAGRLLNENDCLNGKKVCIVDSTIALENYKRIDITGKSVFLEIDNTLQEFTVVGVIATQVSMLSGMTEGQLPSFIYLPYTSVNADLEESTDQIIFKVDKNGEEVSESIQRLLARTNRNGELFRVENISGYREQLDSAMNVITLVLSATAGISLFVAGIGVMNMMLSTVSERYSEIGICMAVGARRWQIGLLFMIEALIIALIGAAVGIVLGVAATELACNAVGAEPIFTPIGIAVPVTVTVLTGAVFGIAPALKAACLQPAMAIRKD
ncbi:MAG: ABC transporter permease [Clostridia bacterium]|nr:ABC transporter permease [Clostridia bacterium]